MDTLDRKKYELCFWLKDDGTGNAPVAIFDSVKDIIQKADGSIISEHQPEKRNLAYPVQKQRSGYWCEIVFALLPESLAKIKEDLRYETAILRKITLAVLEPKIKGKKERPARPAAATQKTEAANDSPEGKQQELDSKLKEILES